VDFEFSPGLNVIVGENGTGKTHVLKLGYLFSRAWPDLMAKRLAHDTPGVQQVYLGERLAGLFQVSNLAALIHKDHSDCACVQAEVDGHIPTVQIRMPQEPPFLSPGLPEPMPWKVQIERTRRSRWLLKAKVVPDVVPESAAQNAFLPQQVFVPSKEMVSLFKGLDWACLTSTAIFRWTKPTAIWLSPCPHWSHAKPPLLLEAVQRMQTVLGGNLKLEKGELVFERTSGRLTPGGSADGRRLPQAGDADLFAALRCAGNGSTLFWDEPEANLNPAAGKLLAAALCMRWPSGHAGDSWQRTALFLLREFEILQMRSSHGPGHAGGPTKYFGLGSARSAGGPVSR
jgi:hypothetical protein